MGNTQGTQLVRFVTMEEFIDSGLRGLYGGESLADIIARKGLQPGQDIFDWMNSEELQANRERAVLTTRALCAQAVHNDPERACRVHFEIAAAVRQRILAAGKTPPECQPTPTTSVKASQRDVQRAGLN